MILIDHHLFIHSSIFVAHKYNKKKIEKQLKIIFVSRKKCIQQERRMIRK